MIDDLLLRWVVTALFAVSTAECVWAIVSHPMTLRGKIGHAWHGAMAVLMIVMAWPALNHVPMYVGFAIFVVGTGWFIVTAVTATDTHSRLTEGYHAVMMAAMAWMYLSMSKLVMGSTGATHASGDHMGSHSGMVHDMSTHTDVPVHNMPGMTMPGMGSSGHMHMHQPGYAITLTWLCLLFFAVATVYWLYRYATIRHRDRDSVRQSTSCQPHTTGPWQYLGVLCQVFMALGMAIMFGAML